MSGKKNTSNVSSKKMKNSNSTSIEADKAEEPVINQAKAVFGRMLHGSSSKANKMPPGNEGSKSTKILLVAQRPKLTKAVEISDDDKQNELSSSLVQPPAKRQKALSSANKEEESDYEEISHTFRLPQDSGNTCDSLSISLVRQESTHAELTAHDFNYVVNFLDQKINSLYQLYRFTINKQKETSDDIKNLIVLDDLSDDFWRKAYKEVTKQLILATLYPSPKEYRVALERYLEEHTDHFINTIGRSAWISYFNEKLLHKEAYEKEQSVSQEQLAEIACVEEAIETAKRTKKNQKLTPPKK
ncbi:14801_t:CDS:2 [Dentiscutata heterogama]|uniref:14801_t:CDS:1 n=1 Tax=Dentiscutata heterogama TaxID=1316150 RepID=A0ACA9KDR6_9GLOM|nr:14801_t:CDS:2 [Dentiscutata heterogama]